MVRHASVRITAHSLDLAASPAALLGQVAALSDAIAAAAGEVRAGSASMSTATPSGPLPD